ncbi:uncharacterized protein ARMOST_20495 [Armillaria ostoyae]|uniref:Uncharacterized protein n=1 Tax=Armillaria ostoyae TaxID=47428 RepID=A0A284S7H6_ARMOS|nr:uncharacterized protein ARMOST_20495 [Armillaria ostoyae]
MLEQTTNGKEEQVHTISDALSKKLEKIFRRHRTCICRVICFSLWVSVDCRDTRPFQSFSSTDGHASWSDSMTYP